jgi:UDPglucose 6-dehydrogenase
MLFTDPEGRSDSVSARMTGDSAPIGVIGTGYVGLVTGAGFAELGSEVWCVDIDEAKIAQLRRGEVPIYEPGLAELIARNRERLHFSTSLEDALEHARLLFVCVGTPPTYAGDADLSAVLEVTESMPASAEHALVMKSTVPCGTGRTLKRMLEEQGKGDLAYVSCPEFLKEGSAIDDFIHPDRVVIGADNDGWAADAVSRLYEPLSAPILRTDVASAEMIKLAANAFLATKISFINEIANVCEDTGANVLEVARGVGLDARIGPRFLAAGIGYGGSCFTKDVSALKLLAANNGYHFQLLASVIEVNELQKRRVIAKLSRLLGSLAGRRIGLLGLAFKPNTDDMRGASSLVLASRLEAEGAIVRAFDPVAGAEAQRIMPSLDCAASLDDVVTGADAIVLVTEWPEFLALDWSRVAAAMAGNVVIDGRNALDPDTVRAAGLAYEGIGVT